MLFHGQVCHVVIALQDYFVDTSLIELLHTSNMLRPSAPALECHSSGFGNTDDVQNSQITEYFPELIFVHNKSHLEDFTSRRIRKTQKFYSKVMAKQSQKGQINWKYETGVVRMTRKMSHLDHANCSGPGQNVNLFFLPDLELSNAGNSRKAVSTESNGITALPDISYDKFTSELRRRILGIPPRPLNTSSAKMTEKSWLNYAQKSWENVKSSSFYVEYGRILTA